MKASIIFLTYLALALSIEDETELKVDYYENLIRSAIQKAKDYKLPTDNNAYFKNVSKDIKDFRTFDFIVVGAGSAGSVIASRLSEVEIFKILLLEAGGKNDDLTEVPYTDNVLQLSERNWGYFTVPQKNGCYGLKERKCAYATGKLLGGSGSINQLAYVRGNKADYDNWAAMGNPGWSFEEVLPFFKKLENFESNAIDLNYRGFGGPVNSVFGGLKEQYDILSEFGMKPNEDYNAYNQIGSFRIQLSTQYARRVSGATAYVKPAATRHNFNVTLRALVTKILIGRDNKTAYAVEFINNGQRYNATARKEVIVSAGGINTPQLLMLSGVGPSDELEKHDIPIIANLPVGKQLRDNYSTFVAFKNRYTQKKISLREAIRDYLNGKGILANPGNVMGISFANTRNASSSVPNVEYIYYAQSPLALDVPLQTNDTDATKNYQKLANNSLVIQINLLHPKSSGTLKLKSNSIIDYPLIDIGIFRDAEDMEIFFEGIKLLTKMVETNLANEVCTKPVKFPLCKQYSLKSREYWFCALRYLTIEGLHVSTTAKMGPKTDPFAVVDYRLRVYGIKRLRVVDCSVLPTTISGHTDAVAYMIGEKAAAMVKIDNGV